MGNIGSSKVLYDLKGEITDEEPTSQKFNSFKELFEYISLNLPKDEDQYSFYVFTKTTMFNLLDYEYVLFISWDEGQKNPCYKYLKLKTDEDRDNCEDSDYCNYVEFNSSNIYNI